MKKYKYEKLRRAVKILEYLLFHIFLFKLINSTQQINATVANKNNHKKLLIKRQLKTIKIQLGLKCNYSCEYCSQRFVPRNSDDTYTHQDESEKTANELYEAKTQHTTTSRADQRCP